MRYPILALAGLACAAVAAGCWQGWSRQPDLSPDPLTSPRPASDAQYLEKVAITKDADAPLPTAIENTLILQDKYAKALEEVNREQQRNRELAEQNRKLAEEAAKLQADLAKAQQELSEANSLLVQMRQELEKWKADVLGFRDENRRASQAQLEALAKVLVLLGGEPPKDTPSAAAPAEAKTPPPARPAQPQPPPRQQTRAAKSAETGTVAVSANASPEKKAASAKPLTTSGKDAPGDATP